ncbi:MAG: hypothetical protein KF777_24905, partial [Planctomycetaceae bacterium]|nr:hypothetical protein [Planctomycetaceae bacterium]
RPDVDVAERQHAEWQARLREGFNKGREKEDRRNVRLPSPVERVNPAGKVMPAMRVYGEGDEVHIVLNSPAASANMQTDAAAFEGWALALRRWAGAQRVTLSWTAPNQAPKSPLSPHHERLVYRAVRFSQLFPSWFSIANDVFGSRALDASSTSKRLLNTPARRDGLREVSLAAMVDLRSWKDERQMECSLRHHPSLAVHFGLGEARRDQQFPVGLFGPKSGVLVAQDGDRIFPGGKGAIDLVCADGDRFWLFELKANENIPLGSLSELLFYTSVLRDVRKGHFGFAGGAWSGCDVVGADVQSASEFIAVLLGDNLHPLLDDPTIWRDLNQAVETTWNVTGLPSVEFRAAVTTVQGFRDIFSGQYLSSVIRAG